MKICALLIFGLLGFTSGLIVRNSYAPAKKNEPASKLQMKHIPKHNTGEEYKPQHDTKVLRNEQEIKHDGTYHYAYELSNGIHASEEGLGGSSVKGSSSYTSPEGIEIKTTYVADETGYHPVGDHIPKIPDYVFRALEYIRTHTHVEEDHHKHAASNNIPKISTQITPPNFKTIPRRTAPPKKNNFSTSKHTTPRTTTTTTVKRNNNKRVQSQPHKNRASGNKYIKNY